MPHITVGFGDIDRGDLPTIVQWLNECDFTWEFTVDNLAFIHDSGGRQELHSRYEIRNQRVPGESSMEGLLEDFVSPEYLQQIYEVRERIKRESGGIAFEDSTEAIRRMREERTEYLMQLHSHSSEDTSPLNE